MMERVGKWGKGLPSAATHVCFVCILWPELKPTNSSHFHSFDPEACVAFFHKWISFEGFRVFFSLSGDKVLTLLAKIFGEKRKIVWRLVSHLLGIICRMIITICGAFSHRSRLLGWSTDLLSQFYCHCGSVFVCVQQPILLISFTLKMREGERRADSRLISISVDWIWENNTFFEQMADDRKYKKEFCFGILCVCPSKFWHISTRPRVIRWEDTAGSLSLL